MLHWRNSTDGRAHDRAQIDRLEVVLPPIVAGGRLVIEPVVPEIDTQPRVDAEPLLVVLECPNHRRHFRKQSRRVIAGSATENQELLLDGQAGPSQHGPRGPPQPARRQAGADAQLARPRAGAVANAGGERDGRCHGEVAGVHTGFIARD